VGAFFVPKIWKIDKKKRARDDLVDFGTLDFGRQCIPLFFLCFCARHFKIRFSAGRILF